MDSLFQAEDSENKKIFVGFFILMIFLLIPNLTLAGQLQDITGNIHIGQLKIHPAFSVKEEYTDNTFMEADHEKDADITTFSPSILFQLPFHKHFLQLACRANIIDSDKYNNYDSDHYYADFMINLDFNKLSIFLGNNWARESTPPDYEEDIRNDYYQNRAFFEATYNLPGRYRVKGFYSNTYRDFNSYRKPWQSDPELDNFTKNDAGFNLYYRFLPLTSFLFEYGFTHINNEDKGLPNTDSDSHRVWLGLTWEATAKINGTIKGGYVKREYDGLSDDWDGFGMKGDLEYKFSKFTTFSFQCFRKILETSVTREAGDYGTYYISTGGTIAVDHRITYKLSVSADLSYNNDNYREKGLIGKEREDDRIGFGLGVNYKIQNWLGCGLGYSFQNNESNIGPEDYEENRVMVNVTLSF